MVKNRARTRVRYPPPDPCFCDKLLTSVVLRMLWQPGRTGLRAIPGLRALEAVKKLIRFAQEAKVGRHRVGL